MPFNTHQLRNEFPALNQEVNKKPLVYLDNAATTQKPRAVIERLLQYYNSENSNIHRGAHFLANRATEAYEDARETVKAFINAQHNHEIVFTKGTTESINLVANSFSQKFLKKGDEVLLSTMEHHSNIVPWQLACEKYGATLKVVPVTYSGELDMKSYAEMLGDKTRIVSIMHVSNTLGTINPVRQMVKMAHEKDIPVLLDGAQALSHMKVNVQEIDCDFYCFSGHKLYGPMGVGVLYGKEKWLEEMPPFLGGGEMIKNVSFEKTTFNQLPFKFEAGTPDVADVLGLQAAIRFISYLRPDEIADHENKLLDYATKKLSELDNIKFYGTASEKTSVISFIFEDIHPFDVGTILDKLGIAVRTGHHCTQPLMDHYGIPGTVRASMAVYNTTEEIDILYEGLLQVRKMFG